MKTAIFATNVRFLQISVFAAALLGASWAQSTPSVPPVVPSEEQKTATDAATPEPKQPPNAPSQKKREQRVQYVLLSDQTWEPITPKEKFRLFTDDLISPGTHLSLAAAAWLSWATNDQPYMGPHFRGWARRYGYSLADEATGQFFGAYALPVIFKQDPRYIPRDRGTRKRRVVYAMTRTLVTRADDGKQTFNVSKVGGTFAVSSLSNLYYPSGRDSSAGATFARAGFHLATDSAYNVFIEFWPDVARKFRLGKFFQQLVRRTVRVPGTY